LLYLQHHPLCPWLQQGTMIYHSQTAQPCWPTLLSSTPYLETLLTPMYVNLTTFQFYIFSYNFLRSTLFKPRNYLSLHHSFLCLGKPCHLTANATTTDPNVCSTVHKLFQGSRQFLHTLLYQNRNNQLNAGSQWPIPWEPTSKKFSQQCSCTFQSVIFVFS
jgi:hypothetical protein